MFVMLWLIWPHITRKSDLLERHRARIARERLCGVTPVNWEAHSLIEKTPRKRAMLLNPLGEKWSYAWQVTPRKIIFALLFPFGLLLAVYLKTASIRRLKRRFK
jgi:hypothetical protein